MTDWNIFTDVVKIAHEEIEQRSALGRRRAKTLKLVPHGLSFTQFMMDAEVSPLLDSMDLISVSEMYDAYEASNLESSSRTIG